MNTSQTHQLLSAEQLEAFLQNKLSAEETKRVQHLLDDCELSREALQGYTLVPGAFADVAGLKKSIAAKSGMNSLSWTTISLGVVAIAAISVFFAMFYDQENTAKTAEVKTDQPEVVVVPEPANTLSPSEDHFVNPEAKVVAVVSPEKVQVANDTQPDANIQKVMIMPILEDWKVSPVVLSVPVELAKVAASYNAQVGFIVDLKVTDFDKYYTAQIEVKELQLTGTDAKFETKDGLGDSKDEKEAETVRIVPADQFVREGLVAFRDARYGKCISKMEVLLQNNPEDVNALFYTAVSYVKLEMFSKAIPLLDKILAGQNNVFHEEARWYKALALEGNGDAAAAKELFKRISDEGGFYAAQARRML